jgi:hypothetical protein
LTVICWADWAESELHHNSNIPLSILDLGSTYHDVSLVSVGMSSAERASVCDVVMLYGMYELKEPRNPSTGIFGLIMEQSFGHKLAWLIVHWRKFQFSFALRPSAGWSSLSTFLETVTNVVTRHSPSGFLVFQSGGLESFYRGFALAECTKLRTAIGVEKTILGI